MPDDQHIVALYIKHIRERGTRLIAVLQKARGRRKGQLHQEARQRRDRNVKSKTLTSRP